MVHLVFKNDTGVMFTVWDSSDIQKGKQKRVQKALEKCWRSKAFESVQE